MKKSYRIILIISLCLLALALAACAAVESISIDGEPRTVYVQGQELDLENTVLMAVKGDETEQVSPSDVTVSGYDKNALGKQTVTFTYDGASTTLEITVIPRIAVEGAVQDYFVGDTFDQSKGRIRVASDDGKTTTVALNDAGVSIENFDSSSASDAKTVTVKYGEYSGTFTVSVHSVGSVELSASPKKTAYSSHETAFDTTGAYFTVKANGDDFSRFVELTDKMVSGFDPSAATLDNRTTPLEQRVVISYLGYNFNFDVKITYSGVSLMRLRASELASVSLDSISEANGEAALDAVRAYFKLTNLDKKLISAEDKDTVVKVASVYGYDSFVAETATFEETFGLVTHKQEEGDITGIFEVNLTSYDAAVRDLERLNDKNDPFVSLVKILGEIEEEFTDVRIDELTLDEYFATLCTDSGLTTIKDITTVMTELYSDLAQIPTGWSAADLEAHKGSIKTAVIRLTDNEYNPFNFPPYFEFFEKLSGWREDNAFFEIIYAYYLEYERDSVVDKLWEKIPFPSELQQLYLMIRYGLEQTNSMKVGTDTSAFMHYYSEAKRIAAEIKESGNQLYLDIYDAIGFDGLISSYFFIGDNVNGIAYVYHSAALVGNARYESLMSAYLDLVNLLYGTEQEIDFTDEAIQADVKELLGLYFDLTPAERLSFLCALHCDYRYNVFDDLVLSSKIDDEGDTVTFNWFAHFLLNGYKEILSEDSFSVFERLLTASEIYALRYREEGRTEEFVSAMEGILADVTSLSSDDTAPYAVMLDELTALYDEHRTPTEADLSAYQTELDALLNIIDVFYEVNAALDADGLTEPERLTLCTLMFAICEKAKLAEDALLAIEDEALQYAYLNKLYTFNNDRNDGDDVDEDITCTLDYIMTEIRGAKNLILINATVNLTDSEGEEYTYNAYKMYTESSVAELLIEAYDLMYACFKGTAAELDTDYVLSTLARTRALDEDTALAFVALNANTLFYGGVLAHFSDKLDAATYEVFDQLIRVDGYYASHVAEDKDETREVFTGAMIILDELYTALEDKSVFNGYFAETYDFFVERYNEMNAAEAV